MMSSFRLRWAALILGLTVIPARTAAQFIVFENTSHIGTYAAYSAEGVVATLGDQVSLAGTARTLTEFAVGMSASGDTPYTADVSLSLYQVGAGNTVGSQIGSTVTLTGVLFPDGPSLVTFAGLSTTVPDQFIWGVTVANLSDPANVLVGWRYGGPPSSGSSDSGFAYSSTVSAGFPAGLAPESSGFHIENLVARITAVPEPQEYLVAFGLLLLGYGLVRGRAARV